MSVSVMTKKKEGPVKGMKKKHGKKQSYK